MLLVFAAKRVRITYGLLLNPADYEVWENFDRKVFSEAFHPANIVSNSEQELKAQHRMCIADFS